MLAEAKRQNKPVFVDIYTTWCGPCKLMAKQAFPDAKVGEKFNANFISYQIDAEKGEGITVAKKCAVDAYPTSLYVSGNGELIHRAVGYGGIPGMLTEADKAIEAAKDENPLSAMEKRYEAGQRDVAFLAGYLLKRTTIGMPNGEALDAYLKATPEGDWMTDDNLNLMAGNVSSSDSRAFGVLYQQLPRLALNRDYRELSGRAQSNLQRALQNDFRRAVADKDERRLDEVVAHDIQLQSLYGKLKPERLDDIRNQHKTKYYLQTKNMGKYRAMATALAHGNLMLNADTLRQRDERQFKQVEQSLAFLPDSIRNSPRFKQNMPMMKRSATLQVANQLNSLAWTYYENMTDSKDLSQALTWSAKSLEYDRSGMYLDTYANLLSKLGRKAEAIKTQEEAIANAKATGEDSLGYEKTLAEMKKK